MPSPTLADLYAARARISGLVRRTPMRPSQGLSEVAGGAVSLKLELLQETGAFKLRGATNKLLSMSEAERGRGVIAVSTGNHGRAVAFAAKRLGVRAVVCVSELVPANKLAAIRATGAELVVTGRSQDEAEVVAGRMVEEEGLVYVSPFDDPDVVAGQGTVGLEILEDVPEVDACLVPLSGGGLLGGIAIALKTANPACRMIGITMERGAAMHASLQAGKPVEVEEVKSLADSLGGGIGTDNSVTLDLCRRLVDEVVLLSEAEIAAGMRHLFMEERLVTEGGASVGVGALLAGKVDLRGRHAVMVVSGQNIDMGRFLEVVSGPLPGEV